jgi:hypothetical protein
VGNLIVDRRMRPFFMARGSRYHLEGGHFGSHTAKCSRTQIEYQTNIQDIKVNYFENI